MDGASLQPDVMPKVPSSRRARPRLDPRPGVLAAQTSEPSTATEPVERVGIPGRKRGRHPAVALARLQADGRAASELNRNVAR